MSNVATLANSGIFEPPAKPKLTKEMKAAAKESGLSSAERKAALKEQFAQMKADYEAAMEIWNAVPDTPSEQVDALREEWEKISAEYKERKAVINAEYKDDMAAAMEKEDPSAKKIAAAYAKNKRRNALLDLSEERRLAKDHLDKATLSSAKIYKEHQRVKLRAAIWRDRYLYLLLVPFVAFYIIFMYVPMYGLLMSFKEYSPFMGVFGSPWAHMNGFGHFYDFFTGPYFVRLISNTLIMNIMLIIFGFPMPIIFALMLNEVRSKMFKTSIQTISYLPYFVSTVVVAGLVMDFLSPSYGIINMAYKWISGSETGIYFMAKPEYFRWIYTLMDIWKGTGFGSIIYTSALAGIDMELYEAAKIDGAGRWRQLMSVTIPGILPTIAIMLIMRLGNILNLGYEAIILMYSASTYETADIISTYVYRIGLKDGNYSLSTAVGLFNGVVALIMVYASNTISRKVGEVGLW